MEWSLDQSYRLLLEVIVRCDRDASLRRDRYHERLAAISEVRQHLVLALLCDEHALGRCDAAAARQAIVERDLGCLQHGLGAVGSCLCVGAVVLE